MNRSAENGAIKTNNAMVVKGRSGLGELSLDDTNVVFNVPEVLRQPVLNVHVENSFTHRSAWFIVRADRADAWAI